MNEENESTPKKSKARDLLELVDSTSNNKNSIKIKSLELTNYRFFYGKDEINNKFDFDGKNVLIYGENGSGKSSLYKALELLTKNKIENGYFSKEKNIFSEENPKVDFIFTNDRELTFDVDSEDIQTFEQRKPDFINNLSIFKPILDYKKLLNIHYSHTETEKINIYSMLRQTLKDYPIEEQGKKTTIFAIKDVNKRLKELENVLNNVLLSNINRLLSFFDVNYENQNSFIPEFKISEFKTLIQDDDGKPEYTVNMYVDFKDNPITSYHSFLNEAKLSALAIAIYFACIKKLLSLFSNNSIKILVLDDLLISLDMSNRLKLIEVIKKEFTEFQVFFFTHDKELFEIYKDKLDWKAFELYCRTDEQIPKSLKKEHLTFKERAEIHFKNKDYDICGLLLRKDLERILQKFLNLTNKENLSTLIKKSIEIITEDKKTILENVKAHNKHILNPSSHNDNRNIYSEELKNAISDLEKLRELEKFNLKKLLKDGTQIKLILTKDNTTIEYFGGLEKSLYFSDTYKFMDCKCKITSKKPQEDNFTKKEYTSLLLMYQDICKKEALPVVSNYYSFFYFKDKLGDWIPFSHIIQP